MTPQDLEPGSVAPGRPGIDALVRTGVLDTELGALLSLLLEARVPAIVGGPPGAGRDAVVDGLLGSLPLEARVVELGGAAEEFAWLPEATELGWRREHPPVPRVGLEGGTRVGPSTTVLLARDLGGNGEAAIGGERARLVVRALALGYGLVAGMSADGLESVLNGLREPPVGADDDERSRIGVVLAVADMPPGSRVVAAHYVRPVSRDTHGHVQRLPPAVLATWDAPSDRWDHFAWGVLPELAIRLGMRPIELEREQARRAADLRSRGAIATS